MLDAQITAYTDYALIRFLTPSLYQSRHHSIAGAIIRLLMPDLVAVERNHLFSEGHEIWRQQWNDGVIDRMMA